MLFRSSGANITAGLKADGTAWVWADTGVDTLATNQPVKFADDAVWVAAGTSFAAAALADGSIQMRHNDGRTSNLKLKSGITGNDAQIVQLAARGNTLIALEMVRGEVFQITPFTSGTNASWFEVKAGYSAAHKVVEPVTKNPKTGVGQTTTYNSNVFKRSGFLTDIIEIGRAHV